MIIHASINDIIGFVFLGLLIALLIIGSIIGWAKTAIDNIKAKIKNRRNRRR